MESDDLRPARAFRKLHDALCANPAWDCATSGVRLVGWSRPGMERFVTWQNAQVTPRAMAKGRFLEIPAMRGSGLYRRAALATIASDGGHFSSSSGSGSSGRSAAAAPAAATAAPAPTPAPVPDPAPALGHASTPAPYRDLWLVHGQVTDCADASDPCYQHPGRAALRPSGWWPVDADFWQRFFAAGQGRLTPLHHTTSASAQLAATAVLCISVPVTAPVVPL